MDLLSIQNLAQLLAVCHDNLEVHVHNNNDVLFHERPCRLCASVVSDKTLERIDIVLVVLPPILEPILLDYLGVQLRCESGIVSIYGERDICKALFRIYQHMAY